MIKIRKTQPTDITILMDIFEQAKHIMRKDGNMLQWRGNYPSREIVIADIEQGNSYVCTDDTEEIIGTFAFIRGNDPTYTHIYEGKWVKIRFLTASFTAGKYRTQQRSGQCLPAMVLRTNTQPTCRYPPGQSYPAIHTEEARIQILRHHPSGQWRRTAGIPKSRRIDKETTNLSFKGVISRQVGLGVKANTRAYVFTEVSALTSSTPDGAERSDNSSNSFK